MNNIIFCCLFGLCPLFLYFSVCLLKLLYIPCSPLLAKRNFSLIEKTLDLSGETTASRLIMYNTFSLAVMTGVI